MRSIAILALCLIFAVPSFAQTRVVKGKLTTFNQYPVQNVEVASKKAKSTVTTDSLGQFEIVCNEKDVIQIKAKVFKALTKRVDEDDDYVTANLVFHDTPKNREIATGLNQSRTLCLRKLWPTWRMKTTIFAIIQMYSH